MIFKLLVASVFALFLTLTSGFSQTLISGTTTSATLAIGPSGNYKLTGDFIYTGSARAIGLAANSSGVTLDLNGYSVITTGSVSIGIGISGDIGGNIVVKNGSVKGFIQGVLLGKSGGVSLGGHVVENVRVEGGPNALAGIRIYGNGFVRNCIVRNIRRDNSVVSNYIMGIGCFGEGSVITNCDVQGVRATTVSVGPGWGLLFGAGSNHSLAVNNRIVDCDMGIRFENDNSKYRDNITTNVTTPYSRGVNVFGND